MTSHDKSPKSGQPTALVIGLTGSIGRAIGERLASRGWRIVALSRRGRSRHASHPVRWIDGDAMDPQALRQAAVGADLIVHAANPPGYAMWRELALPMLENTIAAAEASGATILFPANIYVFNPTSGPLVDEDEPPAPATGKGQVRLEMERLLADAAARGVRCIVVRAGDFFGPGVEGSWFAQAIAKGGRAARAIQDPTRDGAGHGWAYVPDLAEAFARLTDIRADLPPHAVFHFQGHWLADGREMAAAVKRGIGRDALPIRSLPWTMLWFAWPFSRFLRGVIEMRWLWSTPLRLDNRRLEAVIGPEPHTPLHEAIAHTLDATTARPAVNPPSPPTANP
jgi:nucleoside-diphosphate-sugar epimerase